MDRLKKLLTSKTAALMIKNEKLYRLQRVNYVKKLGASSLKMKIKKKIKRDNYLI